MKRSKIATAVFVLCMILLSCGEPRNQRELMRNSFLIGVHVGSQLRMEYPNVSADQIEKMAIGKICSDSPEFAAFIIAR